VYCGAALTCSLVVSGHDSLTISELTLSVQVSPPRIKACKQYTEYTTDAHSNGGVLRDHHGGPKDIHRRFLSSNRISTVAPICTLCRSWPLDSPQRNLCLLYHIPMWVLHERACLFCKTASRRVCQSSFKSGIGIHAWCDHYDNRFVLRCSTIRYTSEICDK
jgi:hypothetical protein